MTRFSHVAVLLGMALLCLTACGTSSSGGQEAQAPAEFSAKDASFVSRAGTSGLEEVAFAQLAVAKANNPAVRSFAGSMIADLTPVNQQLATLTQSKGLTPPTDMDERHAALYQHVESLSGPGFDRGYLDGQLQELTTVIQAFQAEADTGSDPQVRSLAAQNVPMLLEHLRMAKTIAGM
jgi:putative membrane protein